MNSKSFDVSSMINGSGEFAEFSSDGGKTFGKI